MINICELIYRLFQVLNQCMSENEHTAYSSTRRFSLTFMKSSNSLVGFESKVAACSWPDDVIMIITVNV